MRIFDFTTDSPPTDQQFEEITLQLLASLGVRLGLDFEAEDRFIESGCKVTLHIRSASIHKPLLDLEILGLIGYRLCGDGLKIGAVLMPFSRGKRLSVGRDTILIADYVETETGGEWQDFTWSADLYGQWECEELPPVQPDVHIWIHGDDGSTVRKRVR